MLYLYVITLRDGKHKKYTLHRHACLRSGCMPIFFVRLYSSILLSLGILNIASEIPATVVVKNTVFWNRPPYDFANTYQCFGGHFHYSVLKIQTAVSSEKFVVILKSTESRLAEERNPVQITKLFLV